MLRRYTEAPNPLDIKWESFLCTGFLGLTELCTPLSTRLLPHESPSHSNITPPQHLVIRVQCPGIYTAWKAPSCCEARVPAGAMVRGQEATGGIDRGMGSDWWMWPAPLQFIGSHPPLCGTG